MAASCMKGCALSVWQCIFFFNLKQSELLTGDERISEFMELRKILGLSAVAGLLCLTGCTDKTVSGEHEAVTVLAPFLDCDRLA